MEKPSTKMRAGARPSHGNLRQALVEKASQLVDEKGVAALSLREAARLAGVTHQAPYRHFADKRELVAAVAEEGFLALEAEIREALAKTSTSPWERIEAVGTSYVRFAAANPAKFKVMFGEDVADKSDFPSLRVAADGLMGVVTGAVVEGQRSGVIRGGDPLDFALVGWSIMHGLASLLVAGPLTRYSHAGLGVEQMAKRFIEIMKVGIAASPAS
jgi:AcrR family transcriptional regulator